MSHFIQDRGRGADYHPANRFERLAVEIDEGALEEISAADPDFAGIPVNTEFFRDDTQSIISTNQSPDLGFEASLRKVWGLRATRSG